jgi:hypothetical protein
MLLCGRLMTLARRGGGKMLWIGMGLLAWLAFGALLWWWLSRNAPDDPD